MTTTLINEAELTNLTVSLPKVVGSVIVVIVLEQASRQLINVDYDIMATNLQRQGKAQIERVKETVH